MASAPLRVVSDVHIPTNATTVELVQALNTLLAPTKMRILVEQASNGDMHYVLTKPCSKRKKYGVADKDGVVLQNPRTLTKDLIAEAYAGIEEEANQGTLK